MATKVKFRDRSPPPLQAGDYTLTATQTVQVVQDGKTQTHILPEESAHFVVAAPRFRLAPDEIYSLYPPDGQAGDFNDSLPHVVFRRHTLPWERPPAKDQAELPWLALLLFDEDEFKTAKVATSPVAEVRPKGDVPKGLRLPDITLDEMERQPDKDRLCSTIEVPGPLFRRLAPAPSDLPYLAHSRQAETAHKEDIAGIGDGWFSVVLANRLPAAGRRNIVALVSLEGHLATLRDARDPKFKDTVRMVLLGQWAFTSAGAGFAQVADGLAYVGGIRKDENRKDQWLRHHPAATQANGAVSNALELGYVPLPHLLRQGDRTVSWYRGPLTPVPVSRDTRNWLFASSDDALQYDEDTGMFNASYAAAWQVGQLLMLQAPEVARALYTWWTDLAGTALVAEGKTALGHEPDNTLLRDPLFMSVVLELIGKDGP
ncbi:MAG: hypothetical protein HY985_16185 [Magnetospirillum sp.]|nr:hypothetical protein [Magnetospirillum sp.]